MSDGPRIPLEAGRQAASRVATLLGHAAHVVGSIRRGKQQIGDIDLTCAWQEPKADTLYQKLSDLCGLHDSGLFGQESRRMLRAVEGVKPGFRLCRLEAKVSVGTSAGAVEYVLPVQIRRWDEANRGWIELMATGPREFGMAYIVAWREHWQVPESVWKTRPEGKFINASGDVIEIRSEESAFELIKRKFVPPEQRERAATEFWARRSK